MALSEETKAASSVKTQQTSNAQKSEKREKPPTKVIIRRLPPTIDKETFLNQISPVPNYDYFYLVNGEALLGENSFSRAYINFVNPTDVFEFKEKFDNYVFLDHRGNEYAAVVEFAAFQKIPKKRQKNRSDPKCGTIETDPVYLEFVENLNKPVELEDKPEYSYQFLNDNKDAKETITTPLLEFVRNRRVEKLRIREERREERKRKEMERKKIRGKAYVEKLPTIVYALKPKPDDSDAESKEEKPDKYLEKSTSYRNKERKFEDRKKEVKTKVSPRKEYPDKREFKSRREFYKEPKFETYKKEEKQQQFPKKVKKYSEKREERKMEAQLKKAEEQTKTNTEDVKEAEVEKIEEKQQKIETQEENKDKDKDRDSEKEKDVEKVSPKKSASEIRKERIRNKDRPTIAIYRPGMLSKRKLAEGEGDKETNTKDTKGK